MKIFRFYVPHRNHSYAYLKCNPCEKRKILRLIAEGRSNIRYAPDAYGPRGYGAQFIVDAPKIKQ